jgi:hypothetical protein
MWPHTGFLRVRRTAPLLAVLLLSACSKLLSLTSPKATEVISVAAVTLVQGDAQSAQAGRTLATPIVLRLTDAKGKPVLRQAVTLVVASGGGTVDPATAVSDSSGELKVKWTLGTAGVNQTISASVDTVTPVVVKATAIFPATLVVAQGASQSAKVATPLKNDVVVRVQGANGVPMVGIPVTFRVTAGGGAITPQSGTTNSAGEVAAKWTLGATAGANSVIAESGTLAPVTISATATP